MGVIADKIRRAIFGGEVRDSIADGIEVVEQLREDYDRQVINAGNSNAEIVDARGGQAKLKNRLDNFDSHLEQINTEIGVLPETYIAKSGIWGEINLRGINIEWFGAVGDGNTDCTIAIRNAMDFAGNIPVIIPEGNFISKYIYLNSNQKVILIGNLICEQNELGNLFYLDNKENVTILGIGGKAKGSTKDTNNFIKAINSNNICIEGVKLEGFKNKGIDIGDNCFDVIVRKNIVSGSTSVSGAGISALGINCKNVIISDNIVSNCRIGIAVNGGSNHIVSNNVCKDNILMGIGIDGIVAESGDGVKDSIIKGNIITGTIGDSYGGLYIGNGASRNLISNNVITNNGRAGIRISGGEGFKNIRNIIQNNNIYNNTNGIEASYSEESLFLSNIISNNGKGIILFNSDENNISNNEILGNLDDGIKLQSGNNKINNNKIKLNNVGIRIAYGGSNPSYNVIENNDITKNTTSSIINADINTFNHNKGYITENQGIATKLVSGGKIPHGLSGNPSVSPYGSVLVQAKGGSAIGPQNIMVTSDETNITIYFSGNESYDFYWRASVGSIN
ncbi:right-handed parallel beta-helix repeat-containing protein [Clostridium sp. Sa3CUN1]|uniref:Right-handed parallel beta-helix repeat-containing protein n=1 Tax=Clostridium gallinarum TaxID=2762246 RepID=A0ABR8Q1C4_9CLOT|nr:right-handed parallel beta-helix repeat-containing protein [Clostridium gallinarum]MBD7914205.1 right-handed parallel beta-helix repeat-containing protein [Clostridium gallinarum]